MPDAASVAPVCGDGTCAPSEVGKCTQDCGGNTAPVCNNGTCEPPETTASCPADCPAVGPICGDTVCDSAGGETTTNCPGDCVISGTLDCTDIVVALSCTICAIDPTQCSGLGVTPSGCATCGF